MNGATDLFNLDSIPTATDGMPNANAWMDSIPTSLVPDEIVDYPASDPDGGSDPLTTRVPRSWLDMIDSIRQKPGTQSPDLWPKRSNFVRWCVFQGIKRMRVIQQQIDDGEPLDPTLQARIFIEKQGGHIAARAQIMNDATTRANEIAEAVTQLMAMDEYPEAADMLNQWIAAATENDSPFWRTFFCRILLLNEKCAAAVKSLVKDGYIVDEFFISLATTAHVLDIDTQHDQHMEDNE